ncbi:MAG: hypothetical protein ABEI75_01185 [Halobaculum sp.]
MNEPEPAEGFPDDPLTESDAAAFADDPTTEAVWVMDHDPTTRASVLGENPPENAVIELVIETAEAFRLYSYTHRPGGTRWVTYGEEPKGGGFTATLDSYRLLAGDSEFE